MSDLFIPPHAKVQALTGDPMTDPTLKNWCSWAGGGMRGLIGLQAGKYIEASTGKRLTQLFDAQIGSSTGGIIALALAHGLSCAEVEDFYITQGPKIFNVSLWRNLSTAFGMRRSKYAPGALQTALRAVFGNTKLSDLPHPALVTAYEMTVGVGDILCAHVVPEMSCITAALCTSAGPTYFPPVAYGSSCYVDGGVFANCPAGEIAAPGRRVLSFGTGYNTPTYAFQQVNGWGKLEWALPALDILQSSSVQDTEVRCSRLLGRDWLHLDAFVAHPDMDDASEGNIRALQAVGQDIIQRNRAALDAFLLHLPTA